MVVLIMLIMEVLMVMVMVMMTNLSADFNAGTTFDVVVG